MPLLGNSGGGSAGRRGAEWVLRLLIIGLLAWYLVQVLRSPTGGAVEVATSAELPSKLTRWSTIADPERVHAALDYPPPVGERDWLTALAGAGTEISWSGVSLVPTAVVMQPIADPAGGADLAVAAPPRSQVVLRDALGAFDTVIPGLHGIRVYLPSPPALLEAAVGPVVATARLRDSLRLGRLLLLGDAGWEAKFAAAALEERGWKIDALMGVSPKGVQGDVRQGHIGTIDTATYAAILAIDTIATRYADQILHYVQTGGGLVLWTPATTGSLAKLAPGVPEAVLPDKDQAPTDTAPRRALLLTPLGRLKSDALVLEQRNGRAAMAAWRIGAGRVIQTGYVNAWRWRMAGLDGVNRSATDAHRDWLARLVASVAYTSRRPLSVPPGDAAPLVTLVDQLGAATAPVRPGRDLTLLGVWIFGVIVAAAILEWASRRLRGAK